MKRANNIVKIFMLLIAVILLSVQNNYVVAQENTASHPYYNSEHSYRVLYGDAGNDREWILVDSTDDVSHTYNLTDDDATIDWSQVVGIGSAGEGYYGVTIYFDSLVFNHSSTVDEEWWLLYFEYDATHNCVAARAFEITLSENSFYLAAADSTGSCNDESGEVHTYEEINTGSYQTTAQYTVTMNKSTDYDPDLWRCNVAFSEEVDSIQVSVSTTDGGDVSVATVTANQEYEITVNTTASNPEPVVVNVTAYFTGTLSTDYTYEMTVSDGEAVVSATGAPDAVTASATGDDIQKLTVLGVPVTGDILPGNGENATSANNPLQLSTHKYYVEMDDGGNPSSWSIRNVDNNLLTNGSHYDLTSAITSNVDSATITFNSDMTPGTYFIYYEEIDAATNCSSVRVDTITLGDPFDVDIKESSEICATVSGEINNDYTSETTTVITDTVNIVNKGGYSDAWSFNITVAADGTPEFHSNNVDVESMSFSSGANFSGDNYTGKVSVDAGTSQVIVTVTCTGFYVEQYDISVTITDITGSYKEQDADKDDSVLHTIYAMPQAGELAGVD